jgi:PadR family transcriptional regulator AphA
MSGPARHLPDVRPEYIALGFLEREALHGYDIYRRFDAALGRVWRISQSQMYSILKRLEIQGLVSGSAESGERNQAKRRLAITEPGMRRLAEWLAAPSDCSSRIMRLEFISRLFFARASHPEQVAAIVEAQRAAIARQLANHEALLAATPEAETYNRLSLELRMCQLSGIGLWLEKSVSLTLIDKEPGPS